MCGILGFNFISKKISDHLYITNYRGPDNTNWNVFKNFTLGHNRLNIVDNNPLSNQPFISEDGNYVLIFNGEIYNYLDLKKKLSQKYRFKTNSDTELALYQYLEKKEKCLDDFIGMFAFAIYDIKKDFLFCARDRLGIKPFHYYFKNNKFIFSSEIKSILSVLETTPNINKSAISQYLHYLYIPDPNTIYNDIKKLPPAHFLIYNKGKISIKKYWKANKNQGEFYDWEEKKIIPHLDNLLNDAITLRMIANVNLGVFLSGGLDSSTILYYMSKNSNKPINTYTLGFKDMLHYDETKDSQFIANFFKSNHHEFIIDSNIVSLLPKMVFHHDEPFGNPTSLLSYELTRNAKKNATVCLGGDGGDEVFIGYPRYKALLFHEKIQSLQLPKFFFQGINSFLKLFNENTTGLHNIRRIKSFFKSINKSIEEQYNEWVAYFSLKEIDLLLKQKEKFEQTIKNYFSKQNSNNLINTATLTDYETFLPGNLLTYNDRMGMANSFEVRFPLIDHRIVEFTHSINPKLLTKNNVKKYLLKKLLNGKIPNKIINKPKKGLNPPIGEWLKKDMKSLINNYLSKESIEKRELINYDFVKKMIYEHNNNKKDRSLHLWSLIVLEEWFRQKI